MNTQTRGPHRRQLILGGAVTLAAAAAPRLSRAQSTDLKIGMAASVSAMDPHYHLLATNMSVLAHMFEPFLLVLASFRELVVVE
jgi:hypothetical protein